MSLILFIVHSPSQVNQHLRVENLPSLIRFCQKKILHEQRGSDKHKKKEQRAAALAKKAVETKCETTNGIGSPLAETPPTHWTY